MVLVLSLVIKFAVLALCISCYVPNISGSSQGDYCDAYF